MLAARGEAGTAVACEGAAAGGGDITVADPGIFTSNQVVFVVIDSGAVLPGGKGSVGSHQIVVTVTPG